VFRRRRLWPGVRRRLDVPFKQRGKRHWLPTANRNKNGTICGRLLDLFSHPSSMPRCGPRGQPRVPSTSRQLRTTVLEETPTAMAGRRCRPKEIGAGLRLKVAQPEVHTARWFSIMSSCVMAAHAAIATPVQWWTWEGQRKFVTAWLGTVRESGFVSTEAQRWILLWLSRTRLFITTTVMVFTLRTYRQRLLEIL